MRSLILIMAIGLFSVGCVKEVELSSGSLEGGTWYADCFLGEGGGYQANSLSFQDNQFRETLAIFTDNACTAKILEVEELGKYRIGGPSQESSKNIELDLELVAMRITPSTSAVADTYNTQNMCGFNNWESGVSKDVTGVSCGGEIMPESGKILYTIFTIFDFSLSGLPGFEHKAGELSFGNTNATNDGSSPEKRPTALTTLRYHR